MPYAIAPLLHRKSLVILIGGCALIFLPLLIPSTPVLYDSLLKPSFSHLLGTDLLGKDIFQQMIRAIRYSILLAAGVCISSAIVSVVISILTVNNAIGKILTLMFANVLIVLPPFVICLLLISRWSANTFMLFVGEFIAFLPVFLRLSFKELRSVMSQEHAQVALKLGNSPMKVTITHGLSMLLPKLKAQIISLFAIAIGIESGFSYLGIAPPLPHTSLGILLYDSIRYWNTSPWYPISVMVVFFFFISLVYWLLQD